MNDPAGAVTISELRTALRGEVIAPGDPEYDRSRALYLTGFDRRPAAILRPADADDVAASIGLARDSGLPLAVRGGGHSMAGHSVVEGGLVLDLSAMRALEIDATGRMAWAGAGLTVGDYTRAVGAHRLATGFGDSPSVGIGGITLGGGVGFLHRRHGLTIDNLLAAEVVTADGRLLRADSESDPELFWAIRGGGGNFGVATRFQYRLVEVDRVTGGLLILPASPPVLARFVEEAVAAPDALSGLVNVMIAPPMPFLPEDVHGKPIVMSMLLHDGVGDAAERAFAPFRALAKPVVDQIRPLRYLEMFDGPEPPHPAAITMRSFFMDSVDVDAAELMLDRLQRSTAPMSIVNFRVLGGAVARVPVVATAFAHRDRKLMTSVAAVTYEAGSDRSEHTAWVDSLVDALPQDGPGSYVGFMVEGGAGGVRDAYPGPTWDRLRAAKAAYDPGNLFRMNQNVPPAGG